jgi:hypothetical protein
MAYLVHDTLSGYEVMDLYCPRCGCIYVEVT